MRRPVTRSTDSSQPPTTRVSPSSGTWPKVLKMRPPTVSQSPLGSGAPSTSLSSSMGTRPFTRTVPGPMRSIIGTSTSNSSTISPTSSSIRSSRVTTPAVPPYSSTTMAMWNFSACISRSSSDIRLVSGTKWGVRATAAAGESAPWSRSARIRSLAWTTPTTSSMPSVYTGTRL